MNNMTILEVANKLGLTKNALKYRMKNMPPEFIVKTNKINYITNEGYQWLIKNATDLKTTDTTSSQNNINHSTDSKTNELELYKNKLLLLENENTLLKDNINTYKNNSELMKSELEIKNNQIFELTKLLNQQQQLALVDKKENVKSEVPDSEIKNNVPDNKISFWNRIFKRK